MLKHATVCIKSSCWWHLLRLKARSMILHFVCLKSFSYFRHQVWLYKLVISILIALIFITTFLSILILLKPLLLCGLLILIVRTLHIIRLVRVVRRFSGMLAAHHSLYDCCMVFRYYVLHRWMRVHNQVRTWTIKTLHSLVLVMVLNCELYSLIRPIHYLVGLKGRVLKSLQISLNHLYWIFNFELWITVLSKIQT